MTKEEQAGQILRNLGDELDIPDSHYEKATERYDSIGRFLHRPESGMVEHDPAVYPQGSFSLGTVTKSPNGQRPCYDLDTVATMMALSKSQVSQQKLKELLGIAIKAYAQQHNLKKPPHEGNRCWTLEYSDEEVDFHIDVLPAVPDDESSIRALVLMGVPSHFAAHAIAITDKRHNLYGHITSEWPRSNPKGYTAWFQERMKPAGRRILAERRIVASIDDVPTYRWKTPLQRGVQIVKRHRDIYFANDPESKPASIIVTTLAALCYDNQLDPYEAMRAIVNGMPSHIQQRDGVFWIPNPVNPLENFADRWREKREKALKCFAWLGRLRADFDELMSAVGLHKVGLVLKASFGEATANGTLVRLGNVARDAREAGRLRIEQATCILGTTGGLGVPRHTFYGENPD